MSTIFHPFKRSHYACFSSSPQCCCQQMSIYNGRLRNEVNAVSLVLREDRVTTGITKEAEPLPTKLMLVL